MPPDPDRVVVGFLGLTGVDARRLKTEEARRSGRARVEGQGDDLRQNRRGRGRVGPVPRFRARSLN